jgi:hypothetical protein
MAYCVQCSLDEPRAPLFALQLLSAAGQLEPRQARSIEHSL